MSDIGMRDLERANAGEGAQILPSVRDGVSRCLTLTLTVRRWATTLCISRGGLIQ